jgi:enamine deaminase RidA (YjgF/YER057c/UK114 family)
VGRVTDRLAAAGLVLPKPADALGSYVPAVRTEQLVFTSGQLPSRDGSLLACGLVGGEVDLETARECARQAVLNCLAAASSVCDLDDVETVVKLTAYVASAPGFRAQPKVADAASEVLSAAFPDAGGHARAAVGVAELPLGAPVEVELVLALRRE